MSFTNHFLITINEGKLDDVSEKHYDIPESEKEHILNHIPHKNAQHLDWALVQHKKTPLDASELHSTLSLFNQHKDKLQKKNIHQYKTIDELKDAVSSFQPKPVEHTTVYDSPTMKVTQHHTFDAAKEAAKLPKENPYCHALNGKATWCISADSSLGKDRYNTYTNKGKIPFYTIEDKTNKRKYGLVANPLHEKHNVELRDESNNFPHVSKLSVEYDDERKKDPSHNHIDLFSKNHPEIMNTPLKSFFSGEEHDKQLHIQHKIKNGTLTTDEVNHIFNDPSQINNRNYLAHSHNDSDKIAHEHIKTLFNYPHEHSTKLAFMHRKDISPEIIKKGLSVGPKNRVELELHQALASHKNASESNLNTALKSNYPEVKAAAIKNPNITSHNLDTALQDTQPHQVDYNEFKLSTEAIKHPLLNSKQIQQVLTSPQYDEKQKLLVIKHPNASEENLLTAVHHAHPHSKDMMAYRAITHPNATIKVLNAGLKHDNEEVQQKAASLKNEKGS